MKLKSHLFILTAATLLPMVVVGVIASVFFVRHEEEVFRRGATERTRALVTALDRELNSSITRLAALASSRHLETDDIRAFHDEAIRIQRNQPDWTSISLAAPSGLLVAHTRVPFGAELPKIVEQSSFEEVLRAGRPAISTLRNDPVAGDFGFTVRVPVTRRGVVKYVLSAAVAPEIIGALLAAQRIPRDWVAVVVDGNHRIVARTMASEKTAGHLASESLRGALVRSSEGWFRGSTIEGADVYTPFNRSEFSGWTVAFGIPAGVVEAASRGTIRTMALGLAGAVVLGMFLAYVFGRRISVPIISLASTAKAIGQGRRPESAGSRGIEEITDLGRALEEAGAAVRAREETQAYLAAIVESSDDAIISKNLNDIITSWNRGAERLYGYEAGEIIGRPITKLIPPDRMDEEDMILDRIRRGERVENCETVRQRKDGTLLDVSLTVSPLKNAQAEIVGASKIARDITARKRAEETLQRRTRSLEMINRIGTALAAELDLNNIVQMVTDAGREISGAEFGAFFYNVKDERGESLVLYTLSGAPREAFDKFPMPRNTALFDPTFRGEKVVRIGDVLQDPRYGKSSPHYGMPKGHLPVRSYLAVPVISRSGEVLGGLFFGHPDPDVFTAEAESVIAAIAAETAIAIDNANLYQAVRRRVEEFQKLIDTAPIGIGVAEDPNCDRIWGNREFSRMLGVDSGQNLSKSGHGADQLPFKVFREGREVPEVELPMQRACREGKEVLDEDLEIARADGGVVHELCCATPLLDEEGKVRGCIGVFLNITERKEAEKALREARDLLARTNEELEERVRERTASLVRTIEERERLQEQLLHAQKMESLGTLAGGVAHDFNNILNIIQGYTFLIGRAAEDGEIGENLKIINQAVKRGAAVVHQLLTLARKTGAHPELTDVNGMIRGLVEMIRETFPKNIEVSADLEPALPPLMADENQIYQALLNLCVNARDAMPEGGRLSLRTRAVDGGRLPDHEGAEAERYLIIEVTDTGTGIPDSIRSRVFEPFFTTKDAGEGTGLGLAVVYGIVRDQQGFIDLESAPGQGTTVRITLPVLPIQAPVQASDPAGVASAAPEAGRKPLSVLVVEDEESMLHVLRNHLADGGCRVFTASDGEAAVETYRRHKGVIDVVFLDIGLPKLSGTEVLRKIRAENPAARIVVASGYLEPELESALALDGASRFIHKPYAPAEILAALESS